MSIENNYMAKVAMNKSVLKEYRNSSDNRIVYLNNNDEFQICLFNPETFTVGAQISVNGDRENGLIVIRPGERLWIERPLGKQRKYKFETYEVEDSDVVEKATKINGEICVRFYKEYYRKIVRPIYTDYISSSYQTLSNIKSPRFSSEYGATNDILLCNATINNINSDSKPRSVTNSIKSETLSDCNSMLNCDITAKSFEPEKATVETGRISTGDYSSQKFETVNNEFEIWPYKTENIKLLPISRKPYTSSDLQKIYCTECGRKLNPKFKFCPYCGTKCLFYEE